MLFNFVVSVIIGSVIDFRLNFGKNDPLVPDKCGSEYVTQYLTGMSNDSDGSENSTSPQNVSYNVNNIYIIGDIVNASVVKLGESSFGKSPVTNKKNVGPLLTVPFTSSEQPECNASGVKPTKTRMPEYFENTGTTQTSKFTLHDQSTAVHRSTDNMEITCHCPSKTEE